MTLFSKIAPTLSPTPTRLNAHAMVLVLLAALTGCDDSNGNGMSQPALVGCADRQDCVSNPELQIGMERPTDVYIPSDYTPTTRYPLIIVLHGFGANGFLNTAYLGLLGRVDSAQYVLVTPDGTLNEQGRRFWNATPACCAGEAGADVDDVAYIRGLIQEAADTYSIDSTRVALLGHSNGGFMSLRMACEASDLVTTVASLAGSTFADAATCAPASKPVSVLAIHGTADSTIPYEGYDSETSNFPGARETTERFALLAGCDVANATRPANIDLINTVEGDETEITDYRSCLMGTEVSLWTIEGGPHIPIGWTDTAFDGFVEWLIGHPRN